MDLQQSDIYWPSVVVPDTFWRCCIGRSEVDPNHRSPIGEMISKPDFFVGFLVSSNIDLIEYCRDQ